MPVFGRVGFWICASSGSVTADSVISKGPHTEPTANITYLAVYLHNHHNFLG